MRAPSEQRLDHVGVAAGTQCPKQIKQNKKLVTGAQSPSRRSFLLLASLSLGRISSKHQQNRGLKTFPKSCSRIALSLQCIMQMVPLADSRLPVLVSPPGSLHTKERTNERTNTPEFISLGNNKIVGMFLWMIQGACKGRGGLGQRSHCPGQELYPCCAPSVPPRHS